MIPREVINVCSQIGEYYLKRNSNSVLSAQSEVARLRISKVDIVDGFVEITLLHPETLIIGDLEYFLQKRVKIIEERTDWNYLIGPQDDLEEDWEIE